MSEGPQEPESGPASEGHGGSGTGSAFEEEGDELDSVGIEELNAGVDRLLQSIGLQHSEAGINSDLPGCEPLQSCRHRMTFEARVPACRR